MNDKAVEKQAPCFRRGRAAAPQRWGGWVRSQTGPADGQGWDCNTWQSELANSFAWILSHVSPLSSPSSHSPELRPQGPCRPGCLHFPDPTMGWIITKAQVHSVFRSLLNWIKEIFHAYLTSPSQVKPFPPTCKDLKTSTLHYSFSLLLLNMAAERTALSQFPLSLQILRLHTSPNPQPFTHRSFSLCTLDTHCLDLSCLCWLTSERCWLS